MRAAKNLDTLESIAMGLAEEHRRPASEEYDEAMAMAEDLEAAADAFLMAAAEAAPRAPRKSLAIG